MRTHFELLSRLVLAGLLLLAAGCDARLDVVLHLDRDGSGELEVAVGVDAELQQQAAALGVDPLGRAVERIRDGGTGWDAEVADAEDGGRVATIRTDVDDPSQVQARIDELRTALATDEATLLGPLQVVVDDEAQTIAVSGEVVALLGEAAAADAGLPVEELTARLQDVLGTSLTVEAPGPLLADAPGASVVPADPEDPEGPVTLTWTASAGQTTPVSALVQQPSTDLREILLQAGIGVLGLLAIAGGLVAQRRRR